ncbi:hypothetical protein V5799_026347 [Amblyomma americanum]|uniref:Secreted protein n=1 Tax=Amblyomma americanum TaxID=6943 RepID=A0AAQ4DIU4_AMBAM
MGRIAFVATVFLIYSRLSAATTPVTTMPSVDRVALPSATQDINTSVDAAPSPAAVRTAAPVEATTAGPRKGRACGAHPSTLGPDCAPEMDQHYAGFTDYVPFSSTTELAFTTPDARHRDPPQLLPDEFYYYAWRDSLHIDSDDEDEDDEDEDEDDFEEE